MAKIIFPYQVKYENKYFPANTPFDVKDENIKDLISDGGKVVEQKLDKTQKILKSPRKRGTNHDTT